MIKEKYCKIRSKYLAQGLAFLGFNYLKFGFGTDTTYGFINTDQFQIALKSFIELKRQLSSS